VARRGSISNFKAKLNYTIRNRPHQDFFDVLEKYVNYIDVIWNDITPDTYRHVYGKTVKLLLHPDDHTFAGKLNYRTNQRVGDVKINPRYKAIDKAFLNTIAYTSDDNFLLAALEYCKVTNYQANIPTYTDHQRIEKIERLKKFCRYMMYRICKEQDLNHYAEQRSITNKYFSGAVIRQFLS